MKSVGDSSFTSALTATTTTTSRGYGYTASSSSSSSCKSNVVVSVVSGEFPVGLRVLVVDDDTTCLRILEQMLRKCFYHVTTCCQSTIALNLLRKRKGSFDLVISDVHMPDMDGFKLLEHVGLEMDLPVIMMSADGRTSAVMKGIKHGACDYLIKPVRVEELKNIWQHVIRKKWNGVRDVEQSGSLEETDRYKQGGEDIEYSSSANEGTEGTWKVHKKRKDAKEEDDEGDLDNDGHSTSKKPRVVWSVELHQQFVSAVNQLGIEKAVPKRILELMNVPGLTRENVASHLQKFRLYLKRLSGLAQLHSGHGPGESNAKFDSLSGIDIQALAASGQIPPQTLANLHAEFFGRPGSLVLPAKDNSLLLQASLQGAKCIHVERGVVFGKPVVKGQPNISKQFPQSSFPVEDVPCGLGTWLPNNLSAVGSVGQHGGSNAQTNNILRQVLQQQQQYHQSVLPNSSYTINVQPSRVVVPLKSPSSMHTGNTSASFDQSSIFRSVALPDYSFQPSQSHNVLGGLEEVRDANLINSGVLEGYCLPDSISSIPSCSGQSVNVSYWQVQNSTINSSATTRLSEPNMLGGRDVHTSMRDDLPDQVPDSNSGFVGKATSLPIRYALNEFELPMSNLSYGKIYGENDGGRVKQELTLDFTENAKFGIPVIQQFSPSDLTSVL